MVLCARFSMMHAVCKTTYCGLCGFLQSSKKILCEVIQSYSHQNQKRDQRNESRPSDLFVHQQTYLKSPGRKHK